MQHKLGSLNVGVYKLNSNYAIFDTKKGLLAGLKLIKILNALSPIRGRPKQKILVLS